MMPQIPHTYPTSNPETYKYSRDHTCGQKLSHGFSDGSAIAVVSLSQLTNSVFRQPYALSKFWVQLLIKGQDSFGGRNATPIRKAFELT
jgi:hypothetical protein